MTNRYRNNAAVCALITALACTPLPAFAENLMDMVAAAQASDPEYRAAAFQNQADAEATTQAWARFLPHVHASANYNYTNQNIISSDNSVYAVGQTSYPDYGYDVTMELSLFNYADWANLKGARALGRQSDAQFESAKQDMLLRVTERYFTVLAATETADAARAEARALKEHYDLIESKARGGNARSAEVMDAQARYLQSQAKQTQAEASVRDAMMALHQVTGVSPNQLAGLGEKIFIKPLDPADPQHWVEMAHQSNPRVRAAQEATERGHQQVELQRSGWYPDVSLQLQHNRHRTDGSLFGGGSDIEENVGMVKLTVPIYEGGATSSRIREADSLYNKALADEDKAGREVARETRAAVDGIKTAASQVQALAAAMHAQEQVVDQLTQAFKSGVSSNVDVLDAQRDLFLARAEYVRARYDYALDTLKLRHAVGLLDISDLDEVNHLLVSKPLSVDAYGATPIPAPWKPVTPLPPSDPVPKPKPDDAAAAPKPQADADAKRKLAAEGPIVLKKPAGMKGTVLPQESVEAPTVFGEADVLPDGTIVPKGQGGQPASVEGTPIHLKPPAPKTPLLRAANAEQ